MARGWESKNIEDQQAEASQSSDTGKPRLTAEERLRQQQRDSLMLARQYILLQLQAACKANHRNLLEKALADLDAKLKEA